jgi:hypothetical protein
MHRFFPDPAEASYMEKEGRPTQPSEGKVAEGTYIVFWIVILFHGNFMFEKGFF